MFTVWNIGFLFLVDYYFIISAGGRLTEYLMVNMHNIF